MQIVKWLDRLPNDADNEAMWFHRAGKRIKQWRKEHEVNQIAFAHAAQISVGSLQAFERGIRRTRESTVRKIAATIGVTVEQLLNDDPLSDQPDPRIKDLTDDDFVLAARYHHASAEVKHAMKHLLRPDLAEGTRERLALLLAALLRLDDDTLVTIDTFVRELERDDTPTTDQQPDKPKKKSS